MPPACSYETEKMKPSRNYLSKRNQDLSREMQATTRPNAEVYRYSYNLGTLEFRAGRKENAGSFSTKRCGKSQCKYVQEYNPFEQMRICRHNYAGQSTSVSTLMDFAPETKVLKESEISRHDNTAEKQKPFSTNKTLNAYNRCQKINVNVCQRGNNDFHTELVEASGMVSGTVCKTEFEHQGFREAEEHRGERYGNNCDFYPPIEKFRRAARVLGVCLPSKELNLSCGERRNGLCEGHSYDNYLEHATLLRILNKRF